MSTTDITKKMLNKDFTYPKVDDPEFTKKMFEKREIHWHLMDRPPVITSYTELAKHRNKICKSTVEPQPYQLMLPTLINPNTLLNGGLVFQGPGAGKTGGAILVAETFIEQIQKYKTKIHVLVPGPLIKESWKDEILKWTGETYLKTSTGESLGDLGSYVDEEEKQRLIKQAKYNITQNYRIMSHRGFYKKVLGQKIVDQVETDGIISKVARKSDDGEYERDLSADRIENLDNTLLIIDEAHRLADNNYGEAVKKIIKNSKNLKVLLLTATPMKNLGDDIIELVNFIRPQNDPIIREHVFTSTRGHLMEFKEGGQEYLSRMVQGYVFYYRGADQYTYAKQVDQGRIPGSLMFTPVVECPMSSFQQHLYKEIASTDDALYRRSGAVSNFAFPYLSDNGTEIIGTFGIEGLNNLRNQIKINKDSLVSKLTTMLKYQGDKDLIFNSDKNKTIGGALFQMSNLHTFSAKFFTCMNNLNMLVNSFKSCINTDSPTVLAELERLAPSAPKSAGTAFVFCDLVKIGVELFEQCLLANGYLEYNEDGVYNVHSTTRDYLTGIPYGTFMKHKNIFKHKFYPSTFLSITGGSDESGDDSIPEQKKKILDKTFSDIKNVQGKYIKIVIGSKVMTEGITMKNTSEVHVCDSGYHLGKLIQVIGRAIRFCVHNQVATPDNPYPEVRVYRYVSSLSTNEISTDIILYQNAEKKYIMVKKVERILKEAAIDCPINYGANVLVSEVNEFKDCIPPLEYAKLSKSDKKRYKQCPLTCDFQNCDYKCAGKKLNLQYYDANSLMYLRLPRSKLDYTTFSVDLAMNEIMYCKNKIKEMYKYRYVYSLDEIVEHVKNSFNKDKLDLFEDFFIYKALDDLLPISENDFNNFKDTIRDKYDVPGYLIYRNRFYIFQPFNENENVPMFYRSNYQNQLINQLSVFQYFRTDMIKHGVTGSDVGTNNDELLQLIDQDRIQKDTYNFNDVFEFYDKRQEAPYVGIIDKGSDLQGPDVFKIREKRAKVLDKKRGTGIPSLKGAVCFSSKDKQYLTDVAKKIGLKKFDTSSRTSICETIRLRLLYLEKYGKDSDGRKKTWLVLPSNHPTYEFPFNLEDRVQYLSEKVQDKIPTKITVSTKKSTGGIFEGTRSNEFDKYTLKIKNGKGWEMYSEMFIEYGFKLEGDWWVKIIE